MSVAVSVSPVPTVSTEQPLNVATPLVARVVRPVPVHVSVPGPLRLMVTWLLSVPTTVRCHPRR